MPNETNSPKILLQTLRGKKTARTPVWLMRQAGRYLPEYRELRAKKGGFLELCYDAEAAAEVTLQPIKRFAFDGAILFSDILIVPHAMGQKLWFEAGEGPRLAPKLVDAALSSLQAAPEHFEAIYNTVRSVASQIDDKTTFMGFAGSPWTVATYMVQGQGSKDQAVTRRYAYKDEAAFTELISAIIENTVQYLLGQVDAGVEAYSDRAVNALLGFAELSSIVLGDSLGWYAALAEAGGAGMTPAELAALTSTQERYAREWLEQQSVAGFVAVVGNDVVPDDAALHSGSRFALPPGAAEVLLQPESLSAFMPMVRMLRAGVAQLPELLQAYRHGGGVAWAQLGNEARASQAAGNKPWFDQRLGPHSHPSKQSTGCCPGRVHASPTWVPAAAGPRWRWRKPTRVPPSSALTLTGPRSSRRGRMPAAAAWRTRLHSAPPTPPTPPVPRRPAARTRSSSLRPCMICPFRCRCWPACVPW